jgi:hypothetical protein
LPYLLRDLFILCYDSNAFMPSERLLKPVVPFKPPVRKEEDDVSPPPPLIARLRKLLWHKKAEIDHVSRSAAAKDNLFYEIEGEFLCHTHQPARFAISPAMFGPVAVKTIKLAEVYQSLPTPGEAVSNESFVPASLPTDRTLMLSVGKPNGGQGFVVLFDNGAERELTVPPFHRNDFVPFPGGKEFERYLQLLKERKDYVSGGTPHISHHHPRRPERDRRGGQRGRGRRGKPRFQRAWG